MVLVRAHGPEPAVGGPWVVDGWRRRALGWHMGVALGFPTDRDELKRKATIAGLSPALSSRWAWPT